MRETFFHILRYKFRAFLKSTFEWKWVSIVRGLGSLLVFGGFSIGAYALSFAVTKFLLGNVQVGLYVFHRFLSMMFFTLFIAVNLGNIIVSYSTLYRSAEVNFLFTKPVPYAQVFVLKFLDNFLYSSATLFLVTFTALLGYGSYLNYPWYAYVVVMAFVLVPFMFLAACLAVLILMAIMKLAGRIGFRQVMALLAGFYVVLIALFFRYSNPVRLIEFVNQVGPGFADQLRFFEPTFLSYLPSHWAANILFSFARGEVARAFLQTGGLLFATAAAFGVVLVIGSAFYYRSWLVSMHVAARSNDPAHLNRIRKFDFRKVSALPRQLEVLLKREYFMFFREPSQWIHLIVMVVLTMVFALSVGNLNLRLRVTEIQLLTYLVLFAFAGFLSCSVALRFLFPMSSLEGNVFWVIRSAPIETWKVYLIKLILGFILVLVLAQVVAVVTNVPFAKFSGRRPMLLWFGIYSAWWVALAASSINLGLGTYFVNYAEKNPIRLASTQGATLTFLFTLFLLLVIVAIVILPLNEYFLTLFTFKPFKMNVIVAPGTVLAVLSMLITVLGIQVGLKSMQRDF
ncbi:MAG: hypothetical protein HY966_00200 [Ignavibacteriales bacterium]|nr:hypothetical protein [Ignavibacteriales bacterium]